MAKKAKKTKRIKKPNSYKTLEWGFAEKVIEVKCRECHVPQVLNPATYKLSKYGVIRPEWVCQNERCNFKEKRRLADFKGLTGRDPALKERIQQIYHCFSHDTMDAPVALGGTPNPATVAAGEPKIEKDVEAAIATASDGDIMAGNKFENTGVGVEVSSAGVETPIATRVVEAATSHPMTDAEEIQYENDQQESIENQAPDVGYYCPRCGNRDSSGAGQSPPCSAECSPDAVMVEGVRPIDFVAHADEAPSEATPWYHGVAHEYTGLRYVMDQDHDMADAIFGRPPLYGQLPGDNKLILDVGAGVGHATLWFHQKYPDARIVALEPDQACVDLLELNVGDWGCVEVYRGWLDYAMESDGVCHTIEMLLEDVGKEHFDIVRLNMGPAQTIEFLRRVPFQKIGLLLWKPTGNDAARSVMRRVIAHRLGIDFGGSHKMGFDRLPSGAWRIGRKDWWNRG